MAVSEETRAWLRDLAQDVVSLQAIGGNLLVLKEIIAAERETPDDAALGARVRAIVAAAYEDGRTAAA